MNRATQILGDFEVIRELGRGGIFRFRHRWYEQLFDYYVGEIDAGVLLQQAGKSLLNLGEGHYAVELMNLSQGRRAESRRHFRNRPRAPKFTRSHEFGSALAEFIRANLR